MQFISHSADSGLASDVAAVSEPKQELVHDAETIPPSVHPGISSRMLPLVSSNPDEYPEPRETKTRRLQLLVKPSVYDAVSKLARRRGTSVNDLVNTALEAYLDSH